MKSDLRAKIERRFRAGDLRRIEVPEWGDPAEVDDKGVIVKPAAPLAVYYRPVTLADQSFVSQAANRDQHRMAAHLVALKALTETGERMFDQVDATFLMEGESPIIVARLSVQMLGDLTAEQAAKN